MTLKKPISYQERGKMFEPKKCDFCSKESLLIETVKYDKNYFKLCWHCWRKFDCPKDASELTLNIQLKYPNIIKELLEEWEKRGVRSK